MKTYVADIIPKIQRFSQKLDDTTLLTNQHWVVISEVINSKTVYIFRNNGELLIVVNGRITKAKWEYIGNKSILVDNGSESYLFKHGFLDQDVMALKVDGKEEYAFLVNENKYDGEINSLRKVIDFLETNYLKPVLDNGVKTSSGKFQIENHDKHDNWIGPFMWGLIIIILFLALTYLTSFNHPF